MHIEITTTITSRIQIGADGIEGATHSVVIDGDDMAGALPHDALMATVAGGCKSVLKSLEDA